MDIQRNRRNFLICLFTALISLLHSLLTREFSIFFATGCIGMGIYGNPKCPSCGKHIHMYGRTSIRNCPYCKATLASEKREDGASDSKTKESENTAPPPPS